MKVVIPVAGLGTRMLPATKSIPKEMLPVANVPLIQLIVQECAASGVSEIILVTHSSKSAIENHFDTSFELESMLEKRVKRQLLEEVQSITPKGVTIIHVRQGHAKGLGHAVLCAKTVVGDNPFAVVLPDMVLSAKRANLKIENLAAMIKRYNETSISQIMVEAVDKDAVENYGVADVGDKSFNKDDFLGIKKIVEKPSKEEAPSNLAVVGRYVFSPDIWQFLETTTAGVGDEIQLTDAIDELIKHQTVEAYKMRGKMYDCGSKLGYWECFIDHALEDEAYGEDFKKYINKLADQDSEKIIKIN